MPADRLTSIVSLVVIAVGCGLGVLLLGALARRFRGGRPAAPCPSVAPPSPTQPLRPQMVVLFSVPLLAAVLLLLLLTGGFGGPMPGLDGGSVVLVCVIILGIGMYYAWRRGDWQ